MHGAAHRAVGAAAADVGQRVVDLLVGRLGLAPEQRRRRHDEAGLAVAALGHLLLDPGALHRMELPAQPSPSPSMVTTDLPAAALAGSEQERTASPSTCTVQAPHAATPQPNFGPMMSRSSRSTQSSGLSARSIDVAPLAVDGERDHRSMKVSPSTSTSILVRRKQSIASSGLHTTGSFSLKLVLSTIGTPVMSPKVWISRA